MKKVVSFLLVSAAMLVVADAAVAGERDGAISISPFVAGYTFDGVQHLETVPAFGLRLGYDLTKHFGVEGVAHFLETAGTRSGQSLKMGSYRIDLLYNFLPDGPLVPYLAVGGGGLTYGGHGIKIDGENTDATVNAGLGVKYFVTDDIALRGDARQIFALEPPNSPMHNWEYSAGVSFLFGGLRPVAAPVPSTRLSVGSGTVEKGESATINWNSWGAVSCEIEPGIGAVNPNGSMSVTPSVDTDYTLTCKGPGGTANSTAHVTVTAATTNVATTPPLIPPVSAAKPAANPVQVCPIAEVEFATGKADIPRRFYGELAKVGNYLKEHPESKASIQGYTDSIGNKSYNEKLSELRAQGVKYYISKEYGISPSRLAIKGYGSSKPVAENTTSDGRQMNRRVVINPGCPEK